MKNIKLSISAMALAFLSSSALAAITTTTGTTESHTFTVTQVPGFPPMPGPYGNVTLTQQDDGTLVQVNVAPNFVFANGGGGYAFAFNLNPALAGEVIGLSGDDLLLYSVGPAPANQNPYGLFTNAITKLTPGTSPPQDSFLQFVVSLADITDFHFLSTASTMPTHPGGFMFSADLGYLVDGRVAATGTVATDDERNPPNNVPEPGSFALLGTGLLAFGFGRRRFAKKQ